MAAFRLRFVIFNLNETNEQSLSNKPYDIIIIGSGPAGLSLAYALQNSKKRIAVVEAGGENYSTEALEPYKGSVVGDKYFDLQYARQRFFGGTSNHWEGWCRPLEEHDFEEKNYQKLAHWPITRKDLEPYLDKASRILEIDSKFDDKVLNHEYGVKKISFNFSAPPVRFGQKYKFLFNKSNLDLFLNSNLVNFEKVGAAISSATFKSYNNNEIKLNAKTFVLAAGGIENSRLMLAINQKNNLSLFEKNMPIGKYWMEHPHFDIAESIIPTGWNNYHLTLTGQKQKDLGVLGCRVTFTGNLGSGLKKKIRDIACYAPDIGNKLYDMMDRELICDANIRAVWEQAPYEKNKISLSFNQKDMFGIPRPVLHYKKTNFDKNTVYKTIKQIAYYGNQLSYGRIKLFDFVSSLGDYPDNGKIAGYHHMGGTRMSKSSNEGVVDSNLKVHGINNLYIAGSSVFPSGGHANPTLTIVQLSLRLGEHLKSI